MHPASLQEINGECEEQVKSDSKQKKVSTEEQMLHIMQQLQMETTSKDPWKQKGNPLKEAINTREERIARGSAGPSYPGNPPLNLRPRASIFPSHYYPCIQLDIL